VLVQKWLTLTPDGSNSQNQITAGSGDHLPSPPAAEGTAARTGMDDFKIPPGICVNAKNSRININEGDGDRTRNHRIDNPVL
jgi:hypothetical protein